MEPGGSLRLRRDYPGADEQQGEQHEREGGARGWILVVIAVQGGALLREKMKSCKECGGEPDPRFREAFDERPSVTSSSDANLTGEILAVKPPAVTPQLSLGHATNCLFSRD
jgi:hypothetical protein